MPSIASAGILAPESPASGSASASWTIYVIAVVLTTLAALGVLAAVLRAVRGSRGEAEPERRTRGTSAVQSRVGMGLGAAALVLFVVGVIFTERAREVEASSSGAEPLTIQADGQQWIWRYEYPAPEEAPDGYNSETPYSYFDLVIPVDTPITLEVGSTDVLHSWWVPALARAVEAVPGDENTVDFTADEVGTYEGRSTRYSGQGYPTMRTRVHVVEPEEYESFLEERTDDIVAARQAVNEEVEAGTAPGVELAE